MNTVIDQTLANAKASAEATLTLQAHMGETMLACARAGLGMIGKPFEPTAFTTLIQDMAEGQKNAIMAWGKAHTDLAPTETARKKA